MTQDRNLRGRNTSNHSRARLLLTNEGHFVSRDGNIYTHWPAKYSYWARYLDVFDEVVLLARAAPARDGMSALRVDGPGITFRALPDYVGMLGYFQTLRRSREIARAAIAECDCYLLRMPGIVGQMVWREIVSLQKPYALEVVGDPWDALAPGAAPVFLRPILRRVATAQMKTICAGAAAVKYVSATLKTVYTAAPRAVTATFSDILLEETAPPGDVLADRRRRLNEILRSSGLPQAKAAALRIGFLGSFAQLYKGPDVLLRAAAIFRDKINFRIQMVGAGRHLQAMQSLASSLNMDDYVEFCGPLTSGAAVFNFLDSIDLFVMPSRAEGLPRALVEAMSRGCPCVASDVGGIPELLHPEDLVPVGDARKLAEMILRVASDPHRLLAMSERNLAKAAEFSPEALNGKRREFLEVVKRMATDG